MTELVTGVKICASSKSNQVITSVKEVVSSLSFLFVSVFKQDYTKTAELISLTFCKDGGGESRRSVWSGSGGPGSECPSGLSWDGRLLMTLVLYNSSTSIEVTDRVPTNTWRLSFHWYLCFLGWLRKNDWMDHHGTPWKDVVLVRKKPFEFGCRSGSGVWIQAFYFPLSLTLRDSVSTFSLISKRIINGSWWKIWDILGTDIHQCVQFLADQTKNTELVNLNVVLECWCRCNTR